MKRRTAAIVGPGVKRQTKLRPPKPARDLDDFLVFLRQLDEVFGRVARPPRPTTGDWFLL